MDDCEGELEYLNGKIEELETKNNELNDTLNFAQDSYVEKQNEVNTLNQSISESEYANQELKTMYDNVNDELEKCQGQENQHSHDDMELLQQELTELQQELTELQQELTEQQQENTLLKTKSVRALLAVTPQDIVLFNDTLGYNITYGSYNISKDISSFEYIRAKIY